MVFMSTQVKHWKNMVYMVEGATPYQASFLGGVLAQET
jgi:hypothetical protein